MQIEWLLEEPAAREDVRAYLAERAEALKLIVEGTKRPRCRFDVDFGAGLAGTFSQGAPMARASVLLKVAAIEASRSGESERAANHLIQLTALARHLQDDPTLIGQLIRMVILERRHEAFQPDELDLTPDRWKELASALEGHTLADGFARAMEYERACGVAVILNPSDFTGSDDLKTFLGGALWSKIGLNYVRRMNRLVLFAHRPYREVREELERLSRELLEERSFFDVLSALLEPIGSKTQQNLAVGQARLAISRMVCELRAGGKYPEKLEVEDPLSGTSMIYRREGDGFELYSVGPNLHDDGNRNDDTGILDDIGVSVKTKP